MFLPHTLEIMAVSELIVGIPWNKIQTFLTGFWSGCYPVSCRRDTWICGTARSSSGWIHIRWSADWNGIVIRGCRRTRCYIRRQRGVWIGTDMKPFSLHSPSTINPRIDACTGLVASNAWPAGALCIASYLWGFARDTSAIRSLAVFRAYFRPRHCENGSYRCFMKKIKLDWKDLQRQNQ